MTIKLSELEKRIEQYFDECDARNAGITEKKKDEKIPKPYTMSGLLYHIGLTKKEFETLMAKKNFAPVLKSAKARIEAFIEEKALSGELSNNASQGSLKYYFGWGEKDGCMQDDEKRIIHISLSDETRELAK